LWRSSSWALSSSFVVDPIVTAARSSGRDGTHRPVLTIRGKLEENNLPGLALSVPTYSSAIPRGFGPGPMTVQNAVLGEDLQLPEQGLKSAGSPWTGSTHIVRRGQSRNNWKESERNGGLGCAPLPGVPPQGSDHYRRSGLRKSSIVYRDEVKVRARPDRQYRAPPEPAGGRPGSHGTRERGSAAAPT